MILVQGSQLLEHYQASTSEVQRQLAKPAKVFEFQQGMIPPDLERDMIDNGDNHALTIERDDVK